MCVLKTLYLIWFKYSLKIFLTTEWIFDCDCNLLQSRKYADSERRLQILMAVAGFLSRRLSVVSGDRVSVGDKLCVFWIDHTEQLERSWNSRGSEHKPVTCTNRESAIKDHTETTDHDICVNHVQILEKNVNNWHKIIFLESWRSTQDKNTVNKRKPFPSIY